MRAQASRGSVLGVLGRMWVTAEALSVASETDLAPILLGMKIREAVACSQQGKHQKPGSQKQHKQSAKGSRQQSLAVPPFLLLRVKSGTSRARMQEKGRLFLATALGVSLPGYWGQRT